MYVLLLFINLCQIGFLNVKWMAYDQQFLSNREKIDFLFLIGEFFISIFWLVENYVTCSGRASVLWGGGDIPPPVPRHRDSSKYNQNSSDTNHIREAAIKSYFIYILNGPRSRSSFLIRLIVPYPLKCTWVPLS